MRAGRFGARKRHTAMFYYHHLDKFANVHCLVKLLFLRRRSSHSEIPLCRQCRYCWSPLSFMSCIVHHKFAVPFLRRAHLMLDGWLFLASFPPSSKQSQTLIIIQHLCRFTGALCPFALRQQLLFPRLCRPTCWPQF